LTLKTVNNVKSFQKRVVRTKFDIYVLL